jgi:hypothetical protein
MRRNATSSIGAFHPAVFFTFVYAISLFLALFVCRTVYYSINRPVNNETVQTKSAAANITATALR